MIILFFRATNEENNEANKVKNRLTNQWGSVPDTARYYKVIGMNYLFLLKLTNKKMII